MADERQLTDLEGAILTEIAMRGKDTAYKVRRAFQDSPSVQWRGSAGAVSPAIRRLTAAGLIATMPHSKRRGGLALSLTNRGEEALNAWASDIELACGVGLDPFRLRAGVWERLPGKERARLYDLLEARTKADRALFGGHEVADISGRRQSELAIGLLDSRLRWLKRLRASL
jgi:DNA-binding PadR family transcriptional regulator